MDPPVSSSQQTSAARAAVASGADGGRGNPIAALLRFVREVIAELRKVVVPTGRELAGYTVTVLLFVLAMILIVFGLDLAFGWLAQIAFTVGGGTPS